MAQGSGPETNAFARELRRNQTPIEAHLWKRLRANQLAGFKFRRQHPIGQFITDFCCEEVRLVVELDGDTHVEKEEYDAMRTTQLASLGYSVIRVTNRDALNTRIVFLI